MTSRVCSQAAHLAKQTMIGYCKVLGQSSGYLSPRVVGCMQTANVSLAFDKKVLDNIKKYNLSEEKLQRLKKGFEMFDLNKDGRITKAEFHMAANGLQLKDFAVHQMEAWFQQIDLDGNGEISFDEYVHLMQEDPSGWLGMIFADPKDMVVFIFQTYDKFKDGILTKKQVGEMLRYIRGTVTDEEVDEFMKLANTAKDGKLTKIELYNVFKTKKPAKK